MPNPCCTDWYNIFEGWGGYVQVDDGYSVLRTWDWGPDVQYPNPFPGDLCGLTLSLFASGCPDLHSEAYQPPVNWVCPPEAVILNPPGRPPGEYILYYTAYQLTYQRYYNWAGESAMALTGTINVDYRCQFGEEGSEYYEYYGFQGAWGMTGCIGFSTEPASACCCPNCCC